MGPLRSKLVFGTAWLLFWAQLITVAVQDYVRDGGSALWQPVLWESSSGVVATLLLAVQRHYTRAHDDRLATPWRWFGLQLAWLPFNCLAFVPLVYGIRNIVYALFGQTYTHMPWPHLMAYETLKISLLFAVFTVILFGILSFRALIEEKELAQQANQLLRMAQLQQLTAQMQPHFLFNALNTISSLMHVDVARADATLIQLADVLRATLDMSEQNEAPLARELRLAQGYAALMSERFDERVAIDWRIEPAALDCMVPVMSMQPLLENIFKHTVERRRALTRIVVSASCEAGALLLRFDDDSGTLGNTEGPSAGIGVRNLRARLKVLHGDGASLTLSQLSPAGVRADMRLPCAC